MTDAQVIAMAVAYRDGVAYPIRRTLRYQTFAALVRRSLMEPVSPGDGYRLTDHGRRWADELFAPAGHLDLVLRQIPNPEPSS